MQILVIVMGDKDTSSANIALGGLMLGVSGEFKGFQTKALTSCRQIVRQFQLGCLWQRVGLSCRHGARWTLQGWDASDSNKGSGLF